MILNKEFALDIGGMLISIRHNDKFFGISRTPALFLGIISFIIFVYLIKLQIEERRKLKQDFKACKDDYRKKSLHERLKGNKKGFGYIILFIIISEFIFLILHILLVEFTSLY